MADLMVAGKNVFPGPLGGYLAEALPEDWRVVVEPVVQGYVLDAVVLGPIGIYVVQCAPDGAHERTKGRLSGVVAAAALKRFLSDDFPNLKPTISFFAATPPAEQEMPWAVTEPAAMKDQNLANAMLATPGEPDPALQDDEMREALAVALRDRQISANQRARQPFVFRTEGAFGNAAKAWTVHEAVLHMDRHPTDGIYHLRNGTLAEWLESVGAVHLAELARAVSRLRSPDEQARLETFLTGTGMLPRPRLVVRPKTVDLGYVVAGDTATRTISLRSGRGRGYLFGTVVPGEPWLAVEPRAFAGKATDVVVRAETAALQIAAAPHLGDLRADCSAAAVPISIPVRVHVAAMPSPFGRYLLRPLAAAALGAVVGAILGLAVDSWGASLPSSDALLAAPVFWPLAIAVFWALLGLWRGLRQPPAWPIGYAAVRWLAWLLPSAVLLPALVLLLSWLWNRAGPGGARFSPADLTTTIWLSIAAAAIPATVVELLAYRARQLQGSGAAPRRRSRLAIIAGLGFLLVAALLAGAPSIRPAWHRADVQGSAEQATEAVGNAAGRLETVLNGLLDKFYLGLYDRPARAAATPEAVPSAAATPQP